MQNSNQNLSFTITVADSNLKNAISALQKNAIVQNYEYIDSRTINNALFHLYFVWVAI